MNRAPALLEASKLFAGGLCVAAVGVALVFACALLDDIARGFLSLP